MEIEGVLASQRLVIVKLRSIRHKHPMDAVTLGLVAEALEEIAEGVIRLNELYHYKSDDAPAVSGDSGQEPATVAGLAGPVGSNGGAS